MSDRTVLGAFRRQFWQRPRAHGDVVEDRTVSFLELFYDLVYVVVIARAAHHLAAHVSWEGVADFSIVFGLIWIGWLNGTLHHDLHGRGDGRTRTFVFAQMALLTLLAVFTGDAMGEHGRAFALVYAAFFGLLTWMWWSVRREDRRRGDGDRFDWVTSRYVSGMAAATGAILVSALVSAEARRWVWMATAGGFVLLLASWWRWAPDEVRRDEAFGVTPDSLIERFGLFTIIVLGEVVVGAVEGMSEAEGATGPVVATGMIGLSIGFAYWWTYFDFIGDRAVRRGSGPRWMLGHLAVAASIAASGAALVGIVEHAADDRVPTANAWLLSGAVALGLSALVWIMGALEDTPRLPHVYRPLAGWLVLASLVSLLLAWVRPAPWLFVLLVALTLSAVWFLSVIRWFGTDDGEAVPGTVA